MGNHYEGFNWYHRSNAAGYLLAYYCTPTLLKLKPASLFNLNKKYHSVDTDFLEQIKQEIIPFDSSFYVLFEDKVRYLIMVYQWDMLSRVLQLEENRAYLLSAGYDGNHLNTLLKQLSSHYIEYKNQGRKFPHEIGLFLGYPLKDVKSFIENCGKNSICCGYWKVYHDEEQASALFQLFDILKKEAVHILQTGRELNEIKHIYPKMIIQNEH